MKCTKLIKTVDENKNVSDEFYYCEDGEFKFVFSIPAKNTNDYNLNIDFKCKWNDNNDHSHFPKRLMEINAKKTNSSNILISLINLDNSKVNKDNYFEIENYIDHIVSIVSRIINDRTKRNNYFNINVINGREIDEEFLNWLEKQHTTRKKKAGIDETQLVEMIKENAIELNDEFKDMIKKEIPSDIDLDRFMTWLNKEPNSSISSINSLDDLFKLYKETVKNVSKENEAKVNEEIKTQGLNKTTGAYGTEYISENNKNRTTLLINRDNQTLNEQVSAIAQKESLSNGDSHVTSLNTKVIVDEFKQNKEEITVDSINKDDSIRDKDLKTQANSIVASKYEDTEKQELVGNHEEGVYVSDDGKVIEHTTTNNNGIIDVKVNTLSSNIKQDEATLIPDETTTTLTEEEKKLIEKEKLKEIKQRILQQQQEALNKDSQDFSKPKAKKKLPPPNITGYINYYFLITVTIICILVLLLIK